jgi:diguanylate cyclase (GGDEF)-like protein
VKILFVLAIFIFTLYSGTVPEPLDLSTPHEKIGKSLLVFEDKTAKMDFLEVQKLPLSSFSSMKTNVDAHFFTTSAFWYRFEVFNPFASPISRIIVMEIPWIDSIEITIIPPTGEIVTLRGGNNYFYNQRAIDDRLSNVQHSFLHGKSTVYVQVKTCDPFIVPLSVVDHKTFAADEVTEAIHITFVYGFIAAMMLYNLFLFLSIKARYHAYYVLYLSFFVLMNMSYNGLTFKWFFPHDPVIQNWAQSTTIFLFLISGLMFAQSFLNLKHYFPRLDQATSWLILFFIATMVISPSLGYRAHVMLAILFAVFFSVAVFVIAMVSLMGGNRSAKFFLLGSVSSLIGTLITSLSVMALIPYSDMGFKAVDYGTVIDAVLLSLALADRVRITQDEKLIAQKEANTDAMTGLENRKAYYDTSAHETQRAQRYGTPLSVLMLDIDYFKQINDTYGHIEGDKVLKCLASILQAQLRESDHAFRMGGEEFLLLLPNTHTADALVLAQRIRYEVENTHLTCGDKAIFFTVSIGVCEYQPTVDQTIESVERKADEALYRAKNGGRNQVSL